MSYGYDGNGKRVKSFNAITNQTTIFVYDADAKLAAEYTINVPPPTTRTISYLTEDALGSPRVITNSFGEIKSRRDFFPFGEEIWAGYGSRTTNQKYSSSTDDTRKKFATYQRDAETGLDFAQSRYYQPKHGRFTSPDEFKGGPDELFDFEEDASSNPTFYADLENPQSLNKYQYGYNNPYKYNDPTGHCPPCWPIAEIALSVWDVVETVRTFRDPNASRAEKVATVGGTILGIIAPGGGYGVAAKAVTKALRREATEVVVKNADNVVTGVVKQPAIQKTAQQAKPKLTAAQRKERDRARTATEKEKTKVRSAKYYNPRGRGKNKTVEDARAQEGGLDAASKKKSGIDSKKKTQDRRDQKEIEDYQNKKNP